MTEENKKSDTRLFSYRHNYKETRILLQTDSFDQKTTNKLWDIISFFIKKGEDHIPFKKNVNEFYASVCSEIFEKPRDEVDEVYSVYALTSYWSLNEDVYFMIKTNWFDLSFSEKMDTIELLINAFPPRGKSLIIDRFNKQFEESLVGFRITKIGIIISIDSKEELDAINEAIENNHIEKAVTQFKNSDYKNSIKESILAVEGECKSASNKNGKFAVCVKDMSEKFNLHPTFKKSLLDMYGFCSDEDGIRHSNKDNTKKKNGKKRLEISSEEAKLILVWCSAIINYIKIKNTKD